MKKCLILGICLINLFDLSVWAQTTAPAEAPAGVEESTAPAKVPADTCPLGTMAPVVRCQNAEGSLCVDTPTGGVADDHVIIHGFFDSVGGVGDIGVYVQHDYTKQLATIPASDDSETCSAETVRADRPYCHLASGEFWVWVSLPELGPYTISVQTSSAGGDPVQSTLRTSRVVPPSLTEEAVTFDPDPRNSDFHDDHLSLKVGLLNDCTNCDFIGASTGAVTVKVKNRIVADDQSVRIVERETNVSSAGLFSLCLPVGNGQNEISVSVCSTATDGAGCPQLSPIVIPVGGITDRFWWVSPLPEHVLFPADQFKTIPLEFGVRDIPTPAASDTCTDGTVTVTWNDMPPVKICPIRETYKANLVPKTGMNVGTIEIKRESETETHSFSVMWGKIQSPFSAVPGAWGYEKESAGLWLDGPFMTETLRELINRYLASSAFQTMIANFGSAPATASSPVDKTVLSRRNAIRGEMPFCSAGKEGDDAVKIELVGTPKIGKLEIPSIRLEKDEIHLVITAADVSVSLKLYRDEDHDGQADKNIVIPLRLGFSRLSLEPIIRFQNVNGKVSMLLTSATTNCDFLTSDYCESKPALLVPQRIVGNANSMQAFIVCDSAGQTFDDETRELCHDINKVNAQTGLVAHKILSTLNDKLYCDGSTLLTDMVRNGLSRHDIVLGCDSSSGNSQTVIGCGSGDSLFSSHSMRIPIETTGLSGLRIQPSGIDVPLSTMVGAPDVFDSVSSGWKKPYFGYIVPPTNQPTPQLGDLHAKGAAFQISERLLNSLFFMVNSVPAYGSGMLDWDLDEAFFKKVGFDFSTACHVNTEKGEKEPLLCNLRPRVDKMLGTSLVGAGYAAPKDPVRLAVRGNRWLAPRVVFYQLDGHSYVELQISGLDLYLYLLQSNPDQTDYDGNPALVVDANGNAIVKPVADGFGDVSKQYLLHARLSLRLPLELGRPETDPLDPSQWKVMIRPDAKRAKVILSEVSGDNRTTVAVGDVLSSLQSKIMIGLSEQSDPETAPRVALPKMISFGDANPDSLFKALGIDEVSFGENGIQLGVPAFGGYLNIGVNASIH